MTTDLPEAPGRPDITEMNKEDASFTWTEPESDGGSEIFNYVIEYRITGDKSWKAGSKGKKVEDLEYTVTGLVAEREYEFRVAAENKAGVGPFSPPSVPRKYGKI